MKRRFSGTPAQHRKAAGDNARFMRDALNSARHFVSQGRCEAALEELRRADRLQAKYSVDAGWAGKKRSTGLSATAVMRGFRKFKNKCFKAR